MSQRTERANQGRFSEIKRGDAEAQELPTNGPRSWFSRRTYAAAFGNYEGLGPAEEPYNEALVGRTNERARFLTLLFNSGPKCAYLITGHRGSGKTTFVNYCIEEYRRDVYVRFLRSNTGRAFLWDRLGLIGFGVLCLLLALMAHETLLFLLSAKHGASYWTWPIIGIFTLFTFYPLLAALKRVSLVIDRCIELSRPTPRLHRWMFGEHKPNIRPTAYLFVAILFAVVCFPTGDPMASLSQLALLSGLTYLLTTCLSLLTDPGPKRTWITGIVVAVAYCFFYWLTHFYLSGKDTVSLIWLLSGIFVGWALAANALHQWFVLNRWKNNRTEDDPKKLKQTEISVSSSIKWHKWSGIILILLTGYSLKSTLLFLLLGVSGSSLAAISLLIYWRTYIRKKAENPAALYRDMDLIATGLRQRPLLLLLLKSWIFVVIGLHLSYPIIQYILVPLRSLQDWSVPNSLAGKIFQTNHWLFVGWQEKLLWVIATMALFVFISFLEYEWIIRPYQHERTDPALRKPRGAPAKQHKEYESRSRGYYHELAAQTFFWQIYQAWIPLMVIPVNLGFETLDHRRVMEAMLTGLRDSYQREFLGWSSAFNLGRRLIGLLIVLGLTFLASYHWFCLPLYQRSAMSTEDFCRTFVPASLAKEKVEAASTETSCDEEAPLENPAPPGMRLACHVGGEALAQLLYWPIFWEPASPRSETLPKSENNRSSAPGPTKPSAEDLYSLLVIYFPELGMPGGVRPRAYHILLLAFILILGTWYVRQHPLLPYQRTYRDISNLLKSLSSRLREETRSDQPLISRIIGFVGGKEKVRHEESDPFDPRSVELTTLKILEEIQRPALQVPFLTSHRMNFPVPEIIFKFDELDKLGLGAMPPHDLTGPEMSHADVINQERERASALRNLFSDMKNLVSAGAARFVFIGGRNLHDEWLADQTARRPLLTNIFDSEIYLSSLITDGFPWEHKEPLWAGVEAYVAAQKSRAGGLNQRLLNLRYRPWLTPWVEERVDLEFVNLQPAAETVGASGINRRPLQLNLRLCGVEKHKDPSWKQDFQDDFLRFLTYRSLGNVKRLRRLLESFIEPAGVTMANDNMIFDCQHVLRFRDVDRFRVQLVASIYRSAISAFDPRLAYRKS